VASNPANSFFYLITRARLHLMGVWWPWAERLPRCGRGAEMIRVRLSVELCAIYWHFLLFGLLVLLGLLTAGRTISSTSVASLLS